MIATVHAEMRAGLPASVNLESSVRKVSASNWLKRLIWMYFWLLIVEGALRRWIIPSLAGPLLLVREPVAIAILALALKNGLLPMRPALLAILAAALLSFGLTFVAGHGNLYVAMYGLRIFVLHFPLIFVIQEAFTRSDVLKIARTVCLICLPMTALMMAQFFLPQSHFINIGIGGEGTAGFMGAEDRFRPPGTFSFTTGLTQFYSLAAAMIASLALERRQSRQWWWLASVVCVVLAVPLSISRSLLLSILVVGVCFAIVGFGNRELAGRLFPALLSLGTILVAVSSLPAFRSAIFAFSSRWNAANEAEGGLVGGVLIDRFLGGMWGAFTGSHAIPIAGLGLGLGTNAGAMMFSGAAAFLISEGEWGRIVGEMGPLLGLLVVAVRVGLTWSIFTLGLRAWLAGDPLSILLFSVTGLWLAVGGWAQPTALGFSVLGAGLTLAAARRDTDRSNDSKPSVRTSSLPPGRSTFAERLHAH